MTLRARVIAALPAQLASQTARLLPWRRPVIAACLLSGCSAAGYAAEHLRLNAEILDSFSAERNWRQLDTALRNAFTHRRDLLYITVEAHTPDRARALARILHHRLPPRLFRNVHYPAAWPFFRRQELMYRDAAELERLSERLSAAAPWLQRLRPGAGLAELLGAFPLQDPLGIRLTRETALTLAAHAAGSRRTLSWRRLLFGADPPYRERIATQPRLDFDRLLPAAEAVQYLDALQRELGVPLQLDGEVIRDHRGRTRLAGGLTRALTLCAVLVLIALGIGLRSASMAGAAALVLACGMALTAGLAAMAGEPLHGITALCIPLVAGIGVGWTVHYGRCYQAALARLPHRSAALARAAADSAVLIPGALGAIAGCGALLAAPWDALVELGRITGSALLILLSLCFTLLPALLGHCRPAARPTAHCPARPHGLLRRTMPAAIAVALLLIGQMHFEDAPHTPSHAPLAVLADGPEDARAVAAELRRIPGIGRAETPFDRIPDEQERKAASLSRLVRPYSGIARATGRAGDNPEQALRQAAQTPLPKAVRDALSRFEQRLRTLAEPDRRLALQALEADLTGGLPHTLQALAEAVRGRPFGWRALPIDARVRRVSADGRHLVLAWPAPGAELPRLMHALQRRVPGTTGWLMQRHEARRTALLALAPALTLTAAAIALAHLAWTGSPTRLPRLLLPPALAVLLTAAIRTAAGTPLGYTDVGTLPLVFILGATCGTICRRRYATALGPWTTAAGALALVPAASSGTAGIGWALAAGAACCLVEVHARPSAAKYTTGTP